MVLMRRKRLKPGSLLKMRISARETRAMSMKGLRLKRLAGLVGAAGISETLMSIGPV